MSTSIWDSPGLHTIVFDDDLPALLGVTAEEIPALVDAGAIPPASGLSVLTETPFRNRADVLNRWALYQQAIKEKDEQHGVH